MSLICKTFSLTFFLLWVSCKLLPAAFKVPLAGRTQNTSIKTFCMHRFGADFNSSLSGEGWWVRSFVLREKVQEVLMCDSLCVHTILWPYWFWVLSLSLWSWLDILFLLLSVTPPFFLSLLTYSTVCHGLSVVTWVSDRRGVFKESVVPRQRLSCSRVDAGLVRLSEFRRRSVDKRLDCASTSWRTYTLYVLLINCKWPSVHCWISHKPTSTGLILITVVDCHLKIESAVWNFFK